METCIAEAEKNKKLNDVGSKSDPRAGGIISLSDILYRTEANSDASRDGPRSEREESDEEIELDFETSMSGDEGRDAEPNVLHGSLNLRVPKQTDSAREAGGSNRFCGSPSSSCQDDETIYQVPKRNLTYSLMLYTRLFIQPLCLRVIQSHIQYT